MHLNIVRSSISVLSVILLSSALSDTVQAKSCWMESMILSMDDPEGFVTAQSDVVFIGTATAKLTEVLELLEYDGERRVVKEITTFNVETVKKGNLPPGAEIAVEGRGVVDCSCIGDFELGAKYLVYATVDTTGEKHVLRFCGFGGKVE